MPTSTGASAKSFSGERAVPGQQELFGVVLPEVARLHLPAEEGGGPLEHRAEGLAEVHAEVGVALQELAAHDADELRVPLEEVEAGGDDPVHPVPALGGLVGGGLGPACRSVRARSKTSR